MRFTANAFFILIIMVNHAMAAPGDILFSDDFERAALGADWTASVGTAAGINTQTANSGTSALFTRHQAVTVTSRVIPLLVPGARLDVWVRRGADAFSEDPDANEDFSIEYQRADATWVQLASYAGNGTPGETLTPSINLPAAALHNNFQLRFVQSGGSGSDFDYWHVDDVILTETSSGATPPALVMGGCDDFESGLGNWTTTGSSSGTSTATSQSATTSLHLNGGVVTVASIAIDTVGNFQGISVWIRRGADAFSENPDAGENLVVEYFDNTSTWVALETFPGTGTQGQIFNRTYLLPAAASHANFQVRFRLLAGSGPTFDFWHIDDVCINGTGVPALQVTKISLTESDPVNGTSNPKAIPGSQILYIVTVANSGNGAPDNETLVIDDSLASGLSLFVGDLDGSGSPIRFVDGLGVNGSGLTFDFTSLGDTLDDIVFLDGSNNPITPVGVGGYDSNVRAIEITPSGTMRTSSGGSTPSFQVQFRVRID